MTYRRVWGDKYLSDLAALPSEELRTKVRSMTTMLAGNPYLEPSRSVTGPVRSIDVVGQVLLYQICPGAELLFLAVSPHSEATANRESTS